MNLASIFQPKRFAHLLRRDALAEWKTLLIGAIAMIGFLKIVLLISSTDGNDPDSLYFHSFGFSFALLVGGYLFTASIFNEMDTPTGRQFYLQVPASHEEKFLSKFLLSTVGFVALTIVLYSIFAALAGWFLQSQFKVQIADFQPFSIQNLRNMAVYLVTQSVFFLGAVVFRRFAFGKTVAALAVLGIAFAIIAGVVLRIVFYDNFHGMTWTVSEDEFSLSANMERFFRNYSHLLENLFWYALAPLMWVIAYFKLKETEA